MQAWWRVAGIAGAAVAAGLLYFALSRPVKVLPLMGAIPPFELTSHQGKVFRSHERGSRITLYTVAASRDEKRMVETSHLLHELQRALVERGWIDRVDVAFITVDPEFDDQERLRFAAERFAFPEGPNVALLTGSSASVKLAVGNGLGIYYEPPVNEPSGPRFVYDPMVVLVDSHGVTRARHSLQQVTPQRLITDIGLLQKEAAATGASRMVYAAAHLFLCYPR